MQSTSQKPLLKGRQTVAIGAAIIVIPLVVALLSIWSELRTVNSEFRDRASSIHDTLTQRVANLETVLVSLSGLYHASENMSSAEISSFSAEMLKAYPFIHSILYLEQVPAAGSEAFEERMREEGFISFKLRNGQPSQPQTEFHLPVSFIEPMTPQSARVLGYDLALLPAALDTINSAIDSGAIVASHQMELADQKTATLLVYKAVYLGRYPPQIDSERRDFLHGLAALRIDPTHFAQGILTPKEPYKLHLYPGEQPTTIAHNGLSFIKFNQIRLSFARPIDIYGQKLTLSITGQIAPDTFNWWVVIGAWLVSTVILTLISSAYRSQRITKLQAEKAEAAIAAEGARFTQVIETAFDAVITTDSSGRIISWNQHATELFGYKKSEAIDEFLFQLILSTQTLDEEADFLVNLLDTTISSPCNHRVEVICRHKEGNEFPVEMAISNSIIEGLFILSVFIRDISQRKEAEEQLAQAATVFEHANDGFVITDAQVGIISVNQAMEEITGYTQDEILGKNPRIWKSERHEPSFFQAMWSSLEQQDYWRGEIWNRRKSGEIFPCWQSIKVIRDEETGEIKYYVSIVSDITKIKESEERLRHLAHHDPLTNLPNRLLFNARLEHALDQARREESKVAVMFLDLDNFKQINDGLGHPVGDQVLQTVARRLSTQIRGADTVARLSGDEFAIILGEIPNTQSAAHIAGKILSTFETPMQINEQELHLTLTIGISLYPEDGENIASLLKNADAAMYRAKDEGKNRYAFYTLDITKEILDRLRLENDLRTALKQNELHLHYQPQYSLETGQLTGAEALARWSHPELGPVSPIRFIPIAESTGLIIPLGEWVLNEACAKAKSWQDNGLPLKRISVNVAGQQIQRSDFVTTVRQALSRTGLSPHCLELEVTESFIMGQSQEAIHSLEELRKLGVHLAIDDFGTGYSSLSYLKHLPIHRLKIDRSFVKDIPEYADDKAIVQAIIAMAKSLQLNIIAEGVETEEQRAFLESEGCDEMQGFLYSPPVSDEEFVGLLKNIQGL
jgi:diguanylate cyclase (GGDEF)-like protein/PAS domain S-box-containing protein